MKGLDRCTVVLAATVGPIVAAQRDGMAFGCGKTSTRENEDLDFVFTREKESAKDDNRL